MKIKLKKKTRAVETPTLRFSPTAWAKLLFWRDCGDTEVGAFGISESSDNLLLITDIQLIQQTCSWTTVEFDDDSVADFFDAQVDLGRQPEQFARTWIHTHPGECPNPSRVDEETFDRVFSTADWAIMFILACEGEMYARLRFNRGPGFETEIPVTIDYSLPFDRCDHDAWKAEYLANVQPSVYRRNIISTQPDSRAAPADALEEQWLDEWEEYVASFDDQEALAYDTQ